jgi:hypothetical protein
VRQSCRGEASKQASANEGGSNNSPVQPRCCSLSQNKWRLDQVCPLGRPRLAIGSILSAGPESRRGKSRQPSAPRAGSMPTLMFGIPSKSKEQRSGRELFVGRADARKEFLPDPGPVFFRADLNHFRTLTGPRSEPPEMRLPPGACGVILSPVAPFAGYG